MNAKSSLLALVAVAALSSQAAFAGDMNDFDVAPTPAASTTTREAVRADLQAAQSQGLIETGDAVAAPGASFQSARTKAEVRAEGAAAARAQHRGFVATTDING